MLLFFSFEVGREAASEQPLFFVLTYLKAITVLAGPPKEILVVF
jgi:hypothetical protein